MALKYLLAALLIISSVSACANEAMPKPPKKGGCLGRLPGKKCGE